MSVSRFGIARLDGVESAFKKHYGFEMLANAKSSIPSANSLPL
jgi:hypothetical protein